MHQRMRWRSKSSRATRISASIGKRKSSTSSSCAIVSSRLSFQPSARREATTAQGCLIRRTIGMPGKLARIQPRSRLALMSLIRRRRATNVLLNRSVHEFLSAPVVEPQVLLAPEVLERADPAGVEGLEDVAVSSLVVDYLREPRGPAPPAPCEKDGVFVVLLPEVHTEPPEKPRERDAAHRVGFLPRASISAPPKEARNRRSLGYRPSETNAQAKTARARGAKMSNAGRPSMVGSNCPTPRTTTVAASPARSGLAYLGPCRARSRAGCGRIAGTSRSRGRGP